MLPVIGGFANWLAPAQKVCKGQGAGVGSGKVLKQSTIYSETHHPKWPGRQHLSAHTTPLLRCLYPVCFPTYESHDRAC